MDDATSRALPGKPHQYATAVERHLRAQRVGLAAALPDTPPPTPPAAALVRAERAVLRLQHQVGQLRAALGGCFILLAAVGAGADGRAGLAAYVCAGLLGAISGLAVYLMTHQYRLDSLEEIARLEANERRNDAMAAHQRTETPYF